MPRLALINPNTSAATTAAMLEIARPHAPEDVSIEGLTAPFGVPLITNEEALTRSAEAVLALGPRLTPYDGVIVSAFGDPGLAALRAKLFVSVTGIAEAAMAEAGAGGRAFAVATTTPDLAAAITRSAETYGHRALFRGVFLTPGAPEALMRDPVALQEALLAASEQAVRAGAAAVIIGGGPLAVAARAIAPRLAAPLIEPVPAAVRLAAQRLKQEDP